MHSSPARQLGGKGSPVLHVADRTLERRLPPRCAVHKVYIVGQLCRTAFNAVLHDHQLGQVLVK